MVEANTSDAQMFRVYSLWDRGEENIQSGPTGPFRGTIKITVALLWFFLHAIFWYIVSPRL